MIALGEEARAEVRVLYWDFSLPAAELAAAYGVAVHELPAIAGKRLFPFGCAECEKGLFAASRAEWLDLERRHRAGQVVCADCHARWLERANRQRQEILAAKERRQQAEADAEAAAWAEHVDGLLQSMPPQWRAPS